MLNPFKKPKAAGVKVKEPAKTATEAAQAQVAPASKDRRWLGIILAPHLTEKTSAGGGRGWYGFRVKADANKITIRRAVEERYGVGVERVRILYQRSKKMRLGRIQGRSPGFKKAMVKVKEGQNIEFQ